MKPDEFITLHREYLERSDAVKVYANADGEWNVYIHVGGPYKSPDRAREVAGLIGADLTDVYRTRAS